MRIEMLLPKPPHPLEGQVIVARRFEDGEPSRWTRRERMEFLIVELPTRTQVLALNDAIMLQQYDETMVALGRPNSVLAQPFIIAEVYDRDENGLKVDAQGNVLTKHVTARGAAIRGLTRTGVPHVVEVSKLALRLAELSAPQLSRDSETEKITTNVNWEKRGA